MATKQDRLIELMQRHQRNVWRYLRMLGCDPSLADDLTQETFLEAWRRPPEDRGDAATAGWLRTVARNRFISLLRRDGKVLPFGGESDAESAWLAVTPNEDGDERLHALEDCLEKLSGRAREAVDWKYRQEQELDEVAERLETTVDAVKSLLKRARGLLYECIQRRVRP